MSGRSSSVMPRQWNNEHVMANRGLEAKVLTVSDGVVAGTRDDVSGRELSALLMRRGWTIIEHRVCSDGADVVSSALIEMSHGFRGLIVTTGGTGFAPRDETPEGTSRVVVRQAPGLAEAMRAVNPLGRLSRGVAGIRNGSVIVNTPGSPKGCVEQLDAILDVLPHAIALLNDDPTTH